MTAEVFMWDLAIGLIIMLLLCAALFRIGLRIGRVQTLLRVRLISVVTVCSVLSYAVALWDHPLLASLLPFSNLIILGNWFPLGSALLGGLIFDALPRPRRALMISALAASSAWCVIHPLVGSAPRCGAVFDIDGRSFQTTEATCSAACAASLLRSYGIEASEQEMAELCLTRRGTRWQGLYRGLKAKTRGTRWTVEVVACSADDLRQMDGQLILTVGLGESGSAAGPLSDEFGWNPGSCHSVIQLSVNQNGDPLIFDPSPGYGKERWPARHLKRLYRGHAMRLVPKSNAESSLAWFSRSL